MFAAHPGDYLGGGSGERVDRNGSLQIVEKCPAPMSNLFGVRTIDAVSQFGNGYGRDHHRYHAATILDVLYDLENRCLTPFRGNQHAGIED